MCFCGLADDLIFKFLFRCAAGVFCSDCMCVDCCNTVAEVSQVQLARQNIIKHRPGAFDPKVSRAYFASAPLSGCIQELQYAWLLHRQYSCLQVRPGKYF